MTQAMPGPLVSAERPNSCRGVRCSPNWTLALLVIEDDQGAGWKLSQSFLAHLKAGCPDLGIHDFGSQ